jgi:hypothetical protein
MVITRLSIKILSGAPSLLRDEKKESCHEAGTLLTESPCGEPFSVGTAKTLWFPREW